jgi:hypothetical protein
LTLVVASATVYVPVVPVAPLDPPEGADVAGACVGGLVAALPDDFELLEQAARAIAASAAATTTLTLDERIGTSLGLSPHAQYGARTRRVQR